MAINSSIEWTKSTWNPVTGCTKISPGCKNCYAERIAKRLFAMGQPNYVNGFKLTVHEHALKLPLKWKKPQTIFVNSMSDLFHKDIPEEFILKVFNVMNNAPWHTFQILTKRAERLAKVSDRLVWGKNIWMGVSVENADYIYRIDNLRKTKAKVKFISFEPLIDKIEMVNLQSGLLIFGINVWHKKYLFSLSSGVVLIRRRQVVYLMDAHGMKCLKLRLWVFSKRKWELYS